MARLDPSQSLQRQPGNAPGRSHADVPHRDSARFLAAIPFAAAAEDFTVDPDAGNSGFSAVFDAALGERINALSSTVLARQGPEARQGRRRERDHRPLALRQDQVSGAAADPGSPRQTRSMPRRSPTPFIKGETR
jgi:hypothetical protein